MEAMSPTLFAMAWSVIAKQRWPKLFLRLENMKRKMQCGLQLGIYIIYYTYILCRFNAHKIPKQDFTMQAINHKYGSTTIPTTHPNIRVIYIYICIAKNNNNNNQEIIPSTE